MSRGAGKPLFNFRDASGSPPNLGNAPVGHAPAPSTVRQAHLFDEHGLKLVLGSTANVPFTKDELVSHIASHLDADDLAGFEAALAMVRG